MSGENDSTTGTNEGANQGTGSTEGQGGEVKKTEELPPEVLRQKLTEANAEAAKARIELREAKQVIDQAKDLAELLASMKETNAKLERQVLVNEVTKGLSDEHAKLLSSPAMRGATPEELKELADSLRGTVSKQDDGQGAAEGQGQSQGQGESQGQGDTGGSATPPVNLSGGLNPGSGSDSDDPAEIARKLIAGQL